MDKYFKPILIGFFIIILFWLVWFFRFMVICGIIALVLSFISKPLMLILQKIKFKKNQIKNSISAAITLIVIIALFTCIFRWVVPLLIKQIISSTNINADNLISYFEGPIRFIKNALIDLNLLEANGDFEAFIKDNLIHFMGRINYNAIVSGIFTFTWDLILGIFTILFFTFFLLKENNLIKKIVKLIIPVEYYMETNHILHNTKQLISRYFIGICIEIMFLTTFLFICYSIFNFPNALLISFCCGVMVIIPYLGSIIGSGLGFIILLTTLVSANGNIDIVPILLQYFISFGIVKLIDDFVLQPFIYSRSVKAHPLEIFIVIMASGKIGGVIGMILAVPLYTFIRIFAKEFFNKSKLVQSLTKNI